MRSPASHGLTQRTADGGGAQLKVGPCVGYRVTNCSAQLVCGCEGPLLAAPNRRQKRLLSETGLALGASLAPAMNNAAGGEPAAEAPPPNPYAEDPELVLRRRLRRRQNIIIAIVVLTVYYGLAILYYTTRALKTCKNVFNEAPGTNCSDTCMEGWTPADAVYFATVTMTTVGYGDLRPLTSENQVVTVLFLLFGFIVRLCRAGPAAQAIARAVRLAVHRCCSCSRLHRCTLRHSRWGPAC